ncbi:MAG: RibD family protein [Pseudomonadota bacterium]
MATAQRAAGATLDRLTRARAAGEPLVVAQLGQSLDGRIATPTGHSHYVNGDAAITVLHELRAAVDAVIVGAGTAAADDPQLTVRRCAGSNPARVIIDRRRRAGAALKMLRDDGARRIVVGPSHANDPPGVDYVVPSDGPTMAPSQIIAALAARGLSRILVEGGAATVSAFLASGTVSRLCVLVAPLIIGSGPVGIRLPHIDTLNEALRPSATITALEGGDVVFDCDFS